MLTYTGDDPLSADSWTKSPSPVFQGTDEVFSPGHNTFFKSPDGTEDWIVYHANDSASGGCDMNRTPASRNSPGTAMARPTLAARCPSTRTWLSPREKVSRRPHRADRAHRLNGIEGAGSGGAVGRQVQIMINREDERERVPGLPARNRAHPLYGSFAPTGRPWPSRTSQMSRTATGTTRRHNLTFPWVPEYGTVGPRAVDPEMIGWAYISNKGQAPSSEIDRSLLGKSGRLYWARDFSAPNGLAYDARSVLELGRPRLALVSQVRTEAAEGRQFRRIALHLSRGIGR